MSWKAEFANALDCGKYSTSALALADIEVAKSMGGTWGWFDDETEYNETVALVTAYFA